MALPAPTRPPGRSPARRDGLRTRERLVQQGRIAFAEHGLSGTNLREHILGPAGVSVGSFYHQFKDKTELLLAILAEYSEASRKRVSEVHAPCAGRSLADVARDSYALVLDQAEQDSDLQRILIRERDSGDPRVRAFVSENRERWIQSLASDYERLMAPHGLELDCRLAAELVYALAEGVLPPYLEAPAAERPALRARLQDGLMRFTLGGLPALSTKAEAARDPAPPEVEEP